MTGESIFFSDDELMVADSFEIVNTDEGKVLIVDGKGYWIKSAANNGYNVIEKR